MSLKIARWRYPPTRRLSGARPLPGWVGVRRRHPGAGIHAVLPDRQDSVALAERLLGAIAHADDVQRRQHRDVGCGLRAGRTARRATLGPRHRWASCPYRARGRGADGAIGLHHITSWGRDRCRSRRIIASARATTGSSCAPQVGPRAGGRDADQRGARHALPSQQLELVTEGRRAGRRDGQMRTVKVSVLGS